MLSRSPMWSLPPGIFAEEAVAPSPPGLTQLLTKAARLTRASAPGHGDLIAAFEPGEHSIPPGTGGLKSGTGEPGSVTASSIQDAAFPDKKNRALHFAQGMTWEFAVR